jgi:hypothetical protein
MRNRWPELVPAPGHIVAAVGLPQGAMVPAGRGRRKAIERSSRSILRASSALSPPFVDALPSHARRWIIIRDGDTSIVGNRELFHFSSSRFRMSAGRQGCPTGERPPAAEHQDTAELRQGDRQVSPAARGDACRVARMEPNGSRDQSAVARRANARPKVISCRTGRHGSLRRRLRAPTFQPNKSA